ncbi:sensor histidine kinase [Nostoc sp. B(2019)]|nr:sensor histidine kinase [Nostoc sp. B(2019)]
MQDFSHLLSEKVDAIAQQWVEAVAQDKKIKSTKNLSKTAIRDHVPHVLTALVTVLAKAQASDIKTIVEASLEHGLQRAEQGFDPTEVVREYHLLRTIIFTNLHAELLQGTVEEVLRSVSLIDAVVDEAIAQCFQSYVKERLNELEQLQNQLILTVEELRRLVRTSQENLNMLAHELKTPLTSIIGYSELFIRQQRSPELKDTVTSVEHIERVLRSGRQLLHIINDALELSRYEAGKMRLHLATTNVHSIIDTVVETMQPLADKQGFKLLLNCEDAPMQVLTDPLRLQQILTNLVSNAIRYTETGCITIECHSLISNQWAIVVTDTGIGIAPEDQERIFEPFTRADYSNKLHPPDSTGLGLAIVARLVKLLQGKISLTSQLGVGSTFTVILPLEVTTEVEVMATTFQ